MEAENKPCDIVIFDLGCMYEKGIDGILQPQRFFFSARWTEEAKYNIKLCSVACK